ncbi:MAG: DUF4012 domain-containing protein [Chloroflexota bacterium]
MTETLSPRSNRPFRLLLLAGLLLLLLWFGLKGWRIYRASQSLLGRQAEAEAILANGATQANPDAVEALILGVREDVVVLRDETAVFLPLTPYLGWVPQLGPTLLVAPQLMTMADAGTETAVYAITGLKPALVALQAPPTPGSSRISDLTAVLHNAKPAMILAGRAFDRFVAARNQLGDTTALPWRLQTALVQMDELIPLGQIGLRLAPVLPSLLGADGPRRYLIMAQNEDELRPSGGFITGAGLLTIDGGRIQEIAFQDANFVNDWNAKPYAPPPDPLYDFMGLDMFLFRDANFWPDFPASAQKALALYSYGQDIAEPDGVIAIDQHFMKLLVEATGPIPIPDSGDVISHNNIIDTMRGARDIKEGQTLAEWIVNRKAFLGVFANAIRNRIEQDFGSVDPIFLVRNMVTAVNQKHLQLYMKDEAITAVLHDLGWTGSLPQPSSSDFLMAVDTNMGYNKVNVYVGRNHRVDVAVQSDGSSHNSVTLSYRNAVPADNAPCYQSVNEEYKNAEAYLAVAEQCYWNYLRLYVPAEAKLTQATRHFIPGNTLLSGQDWQGQAAASTEFAGLTTFANFMLLGKGGTADSRYSYTVPNVVQTVNGQQQYRLDVWKQAGTLAEPLTVNVTLPSGSRLISTTPPLTAVSDQTLTFTATLDENRTFLVIYEN